MPAHETVIVATEKKREKEKQNKNKNLHSATRKMLHNRWTQHVIDR